MQFAEKLAKELAEERVGVEELRQAQEELAEELSIHEAQKAKGWLYETRKGAGRYLKRLHRRRRVDRSELVRMMWRDPVWGLMEFLCSDSSVG